MSATRRLEFIARSQLTGAAASVSFATGLSGFTKFFLVAYVVNDANAKNIKLRFNNDSGANYSHQFLTATDSTVSSSRTTGALSIQLLGVGTGFTGSNVSLSIVEISKPVAGEVARATVRSGFNTTILIEDFAGEWTNTADLINRIDVVASSNNITTGTHVLLYGSKD